MRKLLIAYIPVLLLASACSKNIENLNNNTKAAVVVPASSVFLAGQKSLVDNTTTPSGGSDPFRFFAQTWTECTYVTEARYILTAYNSPDNWWAALYDAGVLSNLNNAKSLFPSTAASPAILRNDLIITDILE